MSDAVFGFVRPVVVRFRDVDALGHVHHSMALVYAEEVRAAFWREEVGRPGIDRIDYVIAQATANYHSPIHFPSTLTVALRVSRMGGSSFTMEYEIRGADGNLLVTVETVQVMYDYGSSRSKPIPPEMRTLLERWAGVA